MTTPFIFTTSACVIMAITICLQWRHIKRQRERNETEDFKKEIYKRSFGRVNISQIHEGKFFYDGMNFSVEVNNGKLIYTDKETGNKIIKEL